MPHAPSLIEVTRFKEVIVDDTPKNTTGYSKAQRQKKVSEAFKWKKANAPKQIAYFSLQKSSSFPTVEATMNMDTSKPGYH